MRKFFSFIISFTISASLFSQITPNLYKEVDQHKMNQWVDSVFSSMTLEEKVGQLFMTVVDPSSKPAVLAIISNQIKDYHIGGILFGRGNSVEQAVSTNYYQKVSRIPLMIALDGEWGLSMRLSGTPVFPKSMMLGAITNTQTLEMYGEEIGRQCREMGIHVNFAPVLDVSNGAASEAIRYRSFGENPLRVSDCGNAYARGLEKSGVVAAAKHFPGHGGTSVDSHAAIAPIELDSLTLEKKNLYPFRRYINDGFSGIMNGHFNIPALDSVSHMPSSLSPLVTLELLKKKMGFSGLVFTDALVMKGANIKYNASVYSILAGNDIILSPRNLKEDIQAVKLAVKNHLIPPEYIEESCKKVLRYKYLLGLNRYRPIDVKGLYERLNNETSEKICRRLNEESITLVKNMDNILPLKKEKRIMVVSLGAQDTTDFQRTLKKDMQADVYSVEDLYSENLNEISSRLENYDAVILGMHNAKTRDFELLRRKMRHRNLVVCFFIYPYNLLSINPLLSSTQAVVVGYENTVHAQKAAARAISGRIKFQGSLPVSVPGFYPEGKGIFPFVEYGTGMEKVN